MPASTGNSSKTDKMHQKKANMALMTILAIGMVAFTGYIVYKNRDALLQGGAAAAKTLGPVITRLLPALVLGVLSMVVGPEGAILGVPVGLFAGPYLMSGLASIFGEEGAKNVAANVPRIGALTRGGGGVGGAMAAQAIGAMV